MLFLDEPTTGLDPRSRSDLWAEIRALVERGTTVLLTTHHQRDHPGGAPQVPRGRLTALAGSTE
ncbi:MAG: AAA family ATPase [Acidimicrobiales bacterium]